MEKEEKEKFDAEVLQFLKTTAQNCAYLTKKVPTFGFNLKFQVEGKDYNLIYGQQTSQFEYLKDN